MEISEMKVEKGTQYRVKPGYLWNDWQTKVFYKKDRIPYSFTFIEIGEAKNLEEFKQVVINHENTQKH